MRMVFRVVGNYLAGLFQSMSSDPCRPLTQPEFAKLRAIGKTDLERQLTVLTLRNPQTAAQFNKLIRQRIIEDKSISSAVRQTRLHTTAHRLSDAVQKNQPKLQLKNLKGVASRAAVKGNSQQPNLTMADLLGRLRKTTQEFQKDSYMQLVKNAKPARHYLPGFATYSLSPTIAKEQLKAPRASVIRLIT